MSPSFKEYFSKSQNNPLSNLLFYTSVIIFLSLLFSANIGDSRTTLVIAILLIAMILGYVVFHSTNAWIPILICLMLIRDFSLGGLIGEGSLKIGDIFIAYLFLLWWLGKHVNGRSSLFVKSKLDIFIIIFISIHLISLLWSTDMEYGLLRITKLVRNFMFYIIIRELFIKEFYGSYKKATATYIVTGIVLMTVYMSVILLFGGFYDFLSFYQKETLTSLDLGALRARATGGGFLISGPAMWFFITAVLTFGSLTLSNRRVVNILKILLIILFVLGAVLTLQRSLLVMVIIMFLFLLAGSLYIKAKRSIAYISIILVAFAVMGSLLGFSDIFEKRFENAFEDGSWTQRTEFYTSAIDAFRQNPILGIGAGSNYSWQGKYEEIGENRSRIVHSAYLLVLSEVGMVGLGIFLFIIYFWMKYLWDGIKNTHRVPYIQNICMALFAFSASYLVYIVQVGEFEEFEVWFVMAIASAIKNLNSASVGMDKDLSLVGVN